MSADFAVCPECQGDGRILDKSGGGHHGKCKTCLGTGTVPSDLGLRPDADPELVFWRTKALERAHVIHSLRLQNRNLRDALDEAEAENLRLHEELNS